MDEFDQQRLNDLFSALQWEIKKNSKTDRIIFSVDLSIKGNQRLVVLKCICSAGDDLKPVLTVMLPQED